VLTFERPRTRLLANLVLATAAIIYPNVALTQGGRPEVFPQLGHSNSGVDAVAFSPDGKVIVSGSVDGGLRLWNVASGREIRRFDGPSARVTAVAFARDGKSFISGNGGTLRLWDLANGREIRRFEGGPFSGDFAAISPDGGSMLSWGGADKTLRVWDVASGRLIRHFDIRRSEVHKAWIRSAAFSPDGKSIAIGADETLLLWDVASGREIRRFEGHAGDVKAVAFSPDGKTIISGSTDRTLRLWNAASGRQIHLFDGHTAAVTWVAFLPDGEGVVSGSYDDTLRVWDVHSGRGRSYLKGHANFLRLVAMSPDGKSVITARMGSLQQWDLSSGREIRRFAGHSNPVWSVAYSPDGNSLVFGTYRSMVLFDAASGRELRRLEGHAGWVTATAFFRDGKTIISASDDGTLRLWEVAHGREIRRFEGHTDWVASVAISADGKRIVSSGDDKTLRVWDVESGREIRRFEGHNARVTSAVFSPDGRTIASGAGRGDQSLRLWDVESGREVRRWEGQTRDIYSVAFSPDGKTVVSGGGSSAIQVPGVSGGRAYVFDGPVNLLQIWDVHSGREIRRFEGHADEVKSVAFSPDGKTLISASTDRTLRHWDVGSGREIRRFEGHASYVNATTFSPDGARILSASGDGTARIWDKANGRELAALVSSSDGEWLVITPEGYFNASRNGTQWINVRAENEIYPLNQFYDAFYRPDLVERRLAGEDISGLISQTLEHALKNPPPQGTFVGKADVNDPARVTLRYRVASSGGGVGDIRVFHNGKLVHSDAVVPVRGPAEAVQLVAVTPEAVTRGLVIAAAAAREAPQPTSTKPDTVEGSISVEVVPGENEVTVIAFNRTNTVQCEPVSIRVDAGQRVITPKLHVLAVGIDRYRERPLSFAVKDATGFAKLLEATAGTTFSRDNIVVKLLIDEEASRSRILGELAQIAREAKPWDSFVLFVASHGVLHNGVYSIVTHDFSGQLPQGLLGAAELLEAGKAIPALNQLIVLDTCHAGGLNSLARGLYDARMGVLARSSGMHIFASAAEAQEAIDGYQGNGLFTHALLQAMRDPATDRNRDKLVTIIELGEQARQGTIEIGRKINYRQVPTIMSFGKDKPLYHLP